MATFTWTIANVEYNNDADQGVTVAHWRCTGVEGDHTASSYGTTSHTPDPSSDGYVAYADLTEATVLGWVHDQVNQADTEAAIQAKLDALANPTSLSGMPWAAE
jgi:hypothetical protein